MTVPPGEYPPQVECEHDWITNVFEEPPTYVRVCGWCGLAQARNSKDAPWEFFTQMHGESLRVRPPLPGRPDARADADTIAARLRVIADHSTYAYPDRRGDRALLREAAAALDRLVALVDELTDALDEIGAPTESGGIPLSPAGRLRLMHSNLVIDANQQRGEP